MARPDVAGRRGVSASLSKSLISLPPAAGNSLVSTHLPVAKCSWPPSHANSGPHDYKKQETT
jgi:hypothetical protein